jgi:hypothetical protein
MPYAEFLRRQADNCLRIARACFDLTSAERMRLLAGELRAMADEIESDNEASPSLISHNRYFSDRDNSSRP